MTSEGHSPSLLSYLEGKKQVAGFTIEGEEEDELAQEGDQDPTTAHYFLFDGLLLRHYGEYRMRISLKDSTGTEHALVYSRNFRVITKKRGVRVSVPAPTLLVQKLVQLRKDSGEAPYDEARGSGRLRWGRRYGANGRVD